MDSLVMKSSDRVLIPIGSSGSYPASTTFLPTPRPAFLSSGEPLSCHEATTCSSSSKEGITTQIQFNFSDGPEPAAPIRECISASLQSDILFNISYSEQRRAYDHVLVAWAFPRRDVNPSCHLLNRTWLILSDKNVEHLLHQLH
ncbi:hypothetical protein M378DRAFT_912890 [Amanita muscaria Koide BX008]|uniref:Uncharacterized protein n=1 Tax=Amanita muscaria (strain Koide BX008) TaxID=946122 RepID=A0A0C2WV45_AMAMK|nr:hypothetical protein M378DRAFT_912890 [Amanita muscaria Koide BX008]